MSTERIPGIQNQYSEKILSLFPKRSPHADLILFGSRAKGNYREGSDIDLAWRGEGILIQDRDQVLRQYEELHLPWKLDLVVYELIEEPALRDHIDRVGKMIS